MNSTQMTNVHRLVSSRAFCACQLSIRRQIISPFQSSLNRRILHSSAKLQFASSKNSTQQSTAKHSSEQKLTGASTSPKVQRASQGAALPSRLSVTNLNSKVLSAEYAVRGQLVIRAEQLKAELAAGKIHPNNFNRIIQCNIGNPHELGQRPISFFRQVLSLVHYPSMIENVKAELAAQKTDFIEPIHDIHVPVTREAIARAQEYLAAIRSTGAYTNSAGLQLVRQQVASFIRRRDELDESDVSTDQIFITDGASSAVKMIMQLLIRSSDDCVMTPVPQYPLYSATLSLLGGTPTHYFLDEESGWSLNRAELERSIASADKSKSVRAIVIINPGNPTGQCLNEATMNDIISFCERHSLVLLADEVYQTNVYAEGQHFTSFKKLICRRKSKVQLISFHSTSKGFLGECGQRGGYMELHNIDADVTGQIYKLASISLCSNTSGQIMTGLMCCPPDVVDESKHSKAATQYAKERDAIIDSLKRRAHKVSTALNQCQNMTCNAVEGALYAFPRIRLPKLAIAEAERRKVKPDTMYCLELLEHTGLCVVPGSGFGQRDGQFHFRTTILPAEEILDEVLNKLKQFNDQFMRKYT